MCVIRMGDQTACLILTKIWEWIAIYPGGNIGGGVLLTQQYSKGSSKFHRQVPEGGADVAAPSSIQRLPKIPS